MRRLLIANPRGGPAWRRLAMASLLSTAASASVASPTPLDPATTSAGTGGSPATTAADPGTGTGNGSGDRMNASQAGADTLAHLNRGDALSGNFDTARAVDARPPVDARLPVSVDVGTAGTGTTAQGSNSLRDLAAATRDWVHEVLPWTRGSMASDAPVPLDGPAPAERAKLELPIEAGRGAQGAFELRVERQPASAPATASPAAVKLPTGLTATPPGAPRHDIVLVDEPDNALRRAGRFGQSLLTNPLTWLVVVLVAAIEVARTRIRRRRNRSRR